jgi:hypothetical protein
MANAEHLELLKKGAENWNAWRKNSKEVPDLSVADLSELSLVRANLTWANLRGADLSGATLTGACVGWTILGNIDLSIAKGLHTVRHDGPSTIGIDTLYKSGGKIPDIFLRGRVCPIT